MARTPAAPPQMNISITTAIKAGFFGAIGFFVAQIVIVPVILLLLLVCGVSLAGIVGLVAGKSPNTGPARFSNSPSQTSYSYTARADR